LKEAMNNKFNYPIYADRLYTLRVGNQEIKVSGQDLIESYLANIPYTEDLNTPEK